ncbi:MAG TPA: FAD-dependent oxidoreductase, partial [Kiloniellales bacterium]|nr:FAD-dependent oxidoreductase [Kiloniellales bacterium]
MNRSYDAIVIGAGVIGAAVALGLARKGLSVLGVDRLPAAGYGSTSGSCAIIRSYYSTLDGSALGWESRFYWRDWKEFLGTEDERGLARYVECGCLRLKSPANGHLESTVALMDALGCPYEEWSAEEVLERFPGIVLDSFGEAKAIDDPRFGVPQGPPLPGGVFFPHGGYVTDPQLASHNLQRAAEAAGARFRFRTGVTGIRRAGGRVAGVTLDGTEELDAPVVVNVAGPHSWKINRMAGVEEGMNIGTRALRHEVCHVPAPQGMDFEHNGFVFNDGETGVYIRPEMGNHILIGSEDPPCDERQWVDPDDFNRDFTDQWHTQVMRLAQRMPGLGIPSRARGVVELYDVSDDWIPIYDKSDLPG